MRLGFDFGCTPFGIHQVIARLRGGLSCTCDPRFIGIASDVDCPEHGLRQLVAGIASERRKVA